MENSYIDSWWKKRPYFISLEATRLFKFNQEIQRTQYIIFIMLTKHI